MFLRTPEAQYYRFNCTQLLQMGEIGWYFVAAVSYQQYLSARFGAHQLLSRDMVHRKLIVS